MLFMWEKLWPWSRYYRVKRDLKKLPNVMLTLPMVKIPFPSLTDVFKGPKMIPVIKLDDGTYGCGLYEDREPEVGELFILSEDDVTFAERENEGTRSG